MYEPEDFCRHLGLAVDTLEIWIAEGWLRPDTQAGGSRFTDTDLARGRLIGDLRGMGVNDEAMLMVLDLIDQLHGLRHSLQGLVKALQNQPDTVRYRIVADAQRLTVTRRQSNG